MQPTHERIPGISRNLAERCEFAGVLGTNAEDLHLTRRDQVCFTGTEEDPAKQHNQGTMHEVLGDQHMEQISDAPEEAEQEVDPPKELHMLKYGLRESPSAVLHHSIQAYKPSCAPGHVRLAGPDLIDMTDERTTEAYSVQFSSRTV